MRVGWRDSTQTVRIDGVGRQIKLASQPLLLNSMGHVLLGMD